MDSNQNSFNDQNCEIDEENDFKDDQPMEQDQYVEEQFVATFICDSCGYENDIYTTTCLVCEKSLIDVEEEIENEHPCYFCGKLVPVGEYEDHASRCEFEMKIQILRGRFSIKTPINLKKPDPTKKVKKSDTKKCIYCHSPYLLDFINEHEKNCDKKPKIDTKFSAKPEIEKIQFDLENVLHEREYERLTEVQRKALTYMHKKAIHLHQKSKNDLEKKIKKLGYKDQDISRLYDYFENDAPLVIHVNLQKYAEFFIDDTNYRNLFEINSGGSGCTNRLTRKNVEDKIFDNVFFDAHHSERVKYGAMNFTNDPVGVRCAKGYGRSYFILKKHVRPRCTVTFQDSFGCTDADFGTFKHPSHVMMKFNDNEIKSAIKAAYGAEESSSVTHTYKEIQIHGSIEFSIDIETLCIDSEELKEEKNLDNILSFIKLYGIDYKVFETK